MLVVCIVGIYGVLIIPSIVGVNSNVTTERLQSRFEVIQVTGEPQALGNQRSAEKLAYSLYKQDNTGLEVNITVPGCLPM